ncbi:hypothetical protein ON010_g18020 [Phytophthora cinnamomi]|nr:hypothetical protein ON010_g18020 [Phytophthora cinnamomi]
MESVTVKQAAAADARPTVGSGPVAAVTVDPNAADARPTTRRSSGANVGARLKLKSCASVFSVILALQFLAFFNGEAKFN